MKLLETEIEGVLVIEAEPIFDERGFFARTWDLNELETRGLDAAVAQVSIAFSAVTGTLRGLHFQAAPYEEAKTIRCTSGAIWDVAVDLRPDSATRHRWVARELSADNHLSMYVPHGCAHGYITLVDAVEVQYQISAAHNAEFARGHRWDDPAFGIRWPVPVTTISERDAGYAYLEPQT
jgi:dTDP-4-dehydrorhamnose 3,5-epimerase